MGQSRIPLSRILASCVAIATVIVGIAWLTIFGGDDDGIDRLDLNRGLNGAPETLDPRMFSSNQARTVLRDIGEGLVSLSAAGEVVPGVAESWTVSEDGTEYVFKLRASALWSDGSPVEAADFVAAFQRLLSLDDPARNASVISDIRNYQKVIEGTASVHDLAIEELGSHSLRIMLNQPSATFVQKLTHPATFPYRTQDPSREARQVWNGPYVLVRWEQDSLIVLEKNSHYWDAKNTAYEVVNYHIVEETAEYSRYRAGELDITANVTSGIFDKVSKEHPNELRVAPYLGVYYFGFNLDNPLVGDDLALREALSLSIDRETLVEKLLGRGELPATEWVPPGVSGFDFESRVHREDYSKGNRDLARMRFQQSQYESRFSSRGERLTLHYNNSDVQQRIALAVQSMWRDVLGIEVDIVSLDFRVLLSQLQHGQHIHLFRLSWTGDYNDAENFLEVFSSRNPSNYARYRNGRFDELLESARSERSSSKRGRLLAEAEQVLLAEQPIIPLYFYTSRHLVRESVSGWASNVLDEHPSKYLFPSDAISWHDD